MYPSGVFPWYLAGNCTHLLRPLLHMELGRGGPGPFRRGRFIRMGYYLRFVRRILPSFGGRISFVRYSRVRALKFVR